MQIKPFLRLLAFTIGSLLCYQPIMAGEEEVVTVGPVVVPTGGTQAEVQNAVQSSINTALEQSNNQTSGTGGALFVVNNNGSDATAGTSTGSGTGTPAPAGPRQSVADLYYSSGLDETLTTAVTAADNKSQMDRGMWQDIHDSVVGKIRTNVGLIIYQHTGQGAEVKKSDGTPLVSAWLRSWSLIVVGAMTLFQLFAWLKYLKTATLTDPLKALGQFVLNGCIIGIVATNLFTMLTALTEAERLLKDSLVNSLSAITAAKYALIDPYDGIVTLNKAKEAAEKTGGLNPAVFTYAATMDPETFGIEWTKANLDWVYNNTNSIPDLIPVKVDGKIYIGWGINEHVLIPEVENSNREYVAQADLPPETRSYYTALTEKRGGKQKDKDGNVIGETMITTVIEGSGDAVDGTTATNTIIQAWPRDELIQRIISEKLPPPKGLGVTTLTEPFVEKTKKKVQGARPATGTTTAADGSTVTVDVFNDGVDTYVHTTRSRPPTLAEKQQRLEAALAANKIFQTSAVYAAGGVAAAEGKSGTGGLYNAYVRAITHLLSKYVLMLGSWGAEILFIVADAAIWFTAPFLMMSLPFLLSPHEKHRNAFWGQAKNMIMAATLPIVAQITNVLLWYCFFEPIVEASVKQTAGFAAVTTVLIALTYPVALWMLSFKAMETVFSGKSMMGAIMETGMAMGKTALTIGAAAVTGGVGGLAAGIAMGGGGLASAGQALAGGLKGAAGTLGAGAMQSMTSGGGPIGNLAKGIGESWSLARGSNRGTAAKKLGSVTKDQAANSSLLGPKPEDPGANPGGAEFQDSGAILPGGDQNRLEETTALGANANNDSLTKAANAKAESAPKGAAKTAGKATASNGSGKPPSIQERAQAIQDNAAKPVGAAIKELGSTFSSGVANAAKNMDSIGQGTVGGAPSVVNTQNGQDKPPAASKPAVDAKTTSDTNAGGSSSTPAGSSQKADAATTEDTLTRAVAHNISAVDQANSFIDAHKDSSDPKVQNQVANLRKLVDQAKATKNGEETIAIDAGDRKLHIKQEGVQSVEIDQDTKTEISQHSSAPGPDVPAVPNSGAPHRQIKVDGPKQKLTIEERIQQDVEIHRKIVAGATQVAAGPAPATTRGADLENPDVVHMEGNRLKAQVIATHTVDTVTEHRFQEGNRTELTKGSIPQARVETADRHETLNVQGQHINRTVNQLNTITDTINELLGKNQPVKRKLPKPSIAQRSTAE